jgi:hypothetical protein
VLIEARRVLSRVPSPFTTEMIASDQGVLDRRRAGFVGKKFLQNVFHRYCFPFAPRARLHGMVSGMPKRAPARSTR